MRETSFSNCFVIDGKRCKVTSNCNCILWESEATPNHPTVIPLTQVISLRPCFCEKRKQKLICNCIRDEECSSMASVSSSSSTNPSSSSSSNAAVSSKLKRICVYYAVPVGKFGWRAKFVPFHPVTDSESDLNAVQEWVVKTRRFLLEFKRPKRLLVFINPFGGRKKAPGIYKKKVLPLLQLAGCEIDCVVTQRANHAKDTLENVDLPINTYDAIVCVGGDGMFAELLNGIINRAQLESNNENPSPDNALVTPSMPIGVIPAGSTDAVAFSTSGDNDPATSTVHIILGNKVAIDVCAIHSNRDEGKLIRYATSFLGYGYFGDTLKASEKNRWMGPRRYDWAGMKKMLRHRVYNGEIRLHVSTVDGSPKDNDICTADCPLCAKSALRSKYAQELASRPTVEDDGTACVAIRGRFLAINAATMTCRCGMSKNGMSPSAHLGNGCTDLVIVSRCSRANFLRYMMRIGFMPSSPFDLNFVDVYRVKEFEFTPIISPGSTSKSYQLSNASVWNCDGEIIAEPGIHVKVHCQLVTVFGNGRENRNIDKTSKKTQRRVRDSNPVEFDKLKTKGWPNVDSQKVV